MSEIVTDAMNRKLSERICLLETYLSNDYNSLRYLHNRINRISKRIYGFAGNKENVTSKGSVSQDMNDIDQAVRTGASGMPQMNDSSTRQAIGSTMDDIDSGGGLSGTSGTQINTNSELINYNNFYTKDLHNTNLINK